MQTNYVRSWNPALRQGLLFGLLLALFIIVFNALMSVIGWSIWFIGVIMATFTAMGWFIYAVGLVAAFLAYLLAGRRAAQQTGRVSTGASAGLWAAFVNGMITWAYSLIYYATTSTPVHPFVATNVLFDAVFSILLSMVLGAVIGMIGGLLARTR